MTNFHKWDVDPLKGDDDFFNIEEKRFHFVDAKSRSLLVDEKNPGIFLGRILHRADHVEGEVMKGNFFGYTSPSLESTEDLTLTLPSTSVISEEKALDTLPKLLVDEFLKWFDFVPQLAFHVEDSAKEIGILLFHELLAFIIHFLIFLMIFFCLPLVTLIFFS